jgi:hypothetical protein
MYQIPQQSFSQRVALRLHELMWDKHFEPAEALAGLAAALWGLILMLPGDTFATSRSFDAMATSGIAEWIWGAVAVAVGVAQVAGLIFDHWQTRRAAAMALTGLWMFIAAMTGIANVIGPVWAVYLLLSCSAGWAYCRMRVI